MLALYLMLSVTYYAQNYASIIGWSLAIANCNINFIKIDFIIITIDQCTFNYSNNFNTQLHNSDAIMRLYTSTAYPNHYTDQELAI